MNDTIDNKVEEKPKRKIKKDLLNKIGKGVLYTTSLIGIITISTLANNRLFSYLSNLEYKRQAREQISSIFIDIEPDEIRDLRGTTYDHAFMEVYSTTNYRTGEEIFFTHYFGDNPSEKGKPEYSETCNLEVIKERNVVNFHDAKCNGSLEGTVLDYLAVHLSLNRENGVLLNSRIESDLEMGYTANLNILYILLQNEAEAAQALE